MTTDKPPTIEHFTLAFSYPIHEPRKGDPHYAAFTRARAALKKAGKLVCYIGNADCSGGMELHHNIVEYALANDVDVAKFNDLFPEFHCLSDDDFQKWVESPFNLLPLCVIHHRGLLGIHTIHFPAWQVQRFMKSGITAPERKVA